MCSHFVLIPMRVYKVPVSISRAPATDKAGVISGWIGNPSMIVVFVVVIFNEPFGIGVAVMKPVLDVEVGTLLVIDDAAAPFVNALDVPASLPLADDERLEGLRLDELSLMDCGVFAGVFDAAAGAVAVCS